jgi:NADH-quinone oxidoreductase subunit L
LVDLVWLIPALPLAGFLLLVVFGRKLGEPAAGWLATLVMFAAFAATVVVYIGLLGNSADHRQVVQTLFTWVPAGGLTVDAGFLVDPLSIAMSLFITGIGALIHLYSIAYMHGDPKFSKYFLYLNLFAFSMLMLVLSSSLLLTFLGWEGVGACSYFLIAFWFSKDANASAGKKAFIANRVGDWGFLLAMFLTFATLGSLQYVDVLAHASGLAAVTATAITLLLFLAACGKSAQIPLFVWLPDAMAGPTPVSAFIHAATMVTAGVFLLTRMAPVLEASYSWAPMLIATVGAVTALFAATAAIAQNDIKRVLAYSTISQLGYMFLAIGCGAYGAAIFQMITHAFFKALLFLGAGSVIHGMHDEQDMRRMGALRKFMPVTAITFMFGWLAIAGIPPFAGFWSKDDVLLAAWGTNKTLWVIGFVTAGLTAFYMSRQVFLVFYGQPRWDDSGTESPAVVAAAEVDVPTPAHDTDAGVDAHADGSHQRTPHESPVLMLIPLVALAVLSLIGGLLDLPFWARAKFLDIWLEPGLPSGSDIVTTPGATQFALAVVTTLLCIVGILFARRVYLQHKFAPGRIELAVFGHAWYVDEGLTTFMGGPGLESFEATSWFDRNVVDGAVNGVGSLVRLGGRTMRRAQTGYVRNYALGVTVGAVLLVALLLGRV